MALIHYWKKMNVYAKKLHTTLHSLHNTSGLILIYIDLNQIMLLFFPLIQCTGIVELHNVLTCLVYTTVSSTVIKGNTMKLANNGLAL